MFKFFKQKKPLLSSGRIAAMPPLHFKDGDAAFEFCCEYTECPLVAGGSLPALVLDSRGMSGTVEAVARRKDGCQVALLLIASRDGGFIVAASTSGPKGPTLEPGQLVLWRAGQYVTEPGKGAKDECDGCAGLIEGTLKPEFVNGGWVGG